MRGLQLARLDSFEVGTLKVSDVPVLIKNPALRGIPKREMESFSPMALGLSMTIDYAARKLTIGESLPEEAADIRLPMRMHRLAMVRGLINAERPAYFVVDTGGEVISISKATADALAPGRPLGRRIALKVYGTSGWDRDAFLMQGFNLQFRDIEYRNFSVVVLNLRAPSVLLGFQLGGIVGHRFLSPYRVALDLERSEVRLDAAQPARHARSTDGGSWRLVADRGSVRDQLESPLTRPAVVRACGRAARPGEVGGLGAPAVVVGLEQQRRHRLRMARAVDGHEGQVSPAGEPALAGGHLLAEHLDFDLQRRRERSGDARLQDDHVADADGVHELEAIDRRGEGEAVGVPVTGDGAGDVDEVHHRAAEDEPERVRVVRQDDLDGFGRGVLPALWLGA